MGRVLRAGITQHIVGLACSVYHNPLKLPSNAQDADESGNQV